MVENGTKVLDLAEYRRQKLERSGTRETEIPESQLRPRVSGTVATDSAIGVAGPRFALRVVPEEESALEVESLERVSPEDLYRDLGTGGEKARILRIREILGEGVQYLERSLEPGVSELEQGSVVPLLYGCLQEAANFAKHDMTFAEALTVLEVAVACRSTKGYDRRHLLALRDAMRILFDSPFTSETRFNQIIDILENAGFDLGFPIKDVPLEEF